MEESKPFLLIAEDNADDRLLLQYAFRTPGLRNTARRAPYAHNGSEKTLAAVIELVSCSAIRAGSESYVKSNRTRGAATLLKSNIAVSGTTVTLKFRRYGHVREIERPPTGTEVRRIERPGLPGRKAHDSQHLAACAANDDLCVAHPVDYASLGRQRRPNSAVRVGLVWQRT